MQKLLLLSNSTNSGEAYLSWPRPFISDFLKQSVKKILFIPYAGVALDKTSLEASWNLYEKLVQAVFSELGYEIYSIHHCKDAVKAIQEAECVAVGGGNTFYLNYMLHEAGIISALQAKIKAGMPYIGWSAGSNVAGPSIKTTNDMPIVEPKSFDCLNVVPFQINPHYLDAHPSGHGGETREQRIDEFITVNKNTCVVGLREACLLQIENGKIELKGPHSMRIFKFGNAPYELLKNDNLQFLLNN